MRTALRLTAVAITLFAIPANGARVAPVHAALAAAAAQAPAPAPDAADVAEGMRLYLQKGD